MTRVLCVVSRVGELKEWSVGGDSWRERERERESEREREREGSVGMMRWTYSLKWEEVWGRER